MNVNERSSMFKSKSGRHFFNDKGAEREDRKRFRHKERHEAYFKNREIQLASDKSKSHGSSSLKIDEWNNRGSRQQSIPAINRQQQFRERFKQYLKKKTDDKQSKAKTKPFVTAVAKGRFVEVTKENVAKIQKNNLVSHAEKKQKKTLEFSPIITRSKKNLLHTPLQTPNGRRKKQTTKDMENEDKTHIGLSKNNRPSIQVSRAVAKKQIDSDEFNVQKNEKAGLPCSKSRQKDNIIVKSNKIGPRTLESKNIKTNIITSTVSKPKKMSISRPLLKTKNGNGIFNESISPIEDIHVSCLPQTAYETPTVKTKQSMVNSASNDSSDQMDSISYLDSSKGAALNYVSPFVTISRGSRTSSRKEKEARNSKYTLESRKSFDLNRSVEQRQHIEAAIYFRQQVQRETDRFNGLITNWQEYAKENQMTVPSECIDLINVAIGQTNLLTTSKFKQFNRLIDQCENDEDNEVVKPEDLEGFWSMVYLQVENCNKRFERLHFLKANDWVDPEINIVKQKKLRTTNSMVTKHKTTKRNNSVLASILKEARKNCKSKIDNQQGNFIFVSSSNSQKLQSTFQSTPHRKQTPSKNGWMVEHFGESDRSNITTPARGILKTPNSVSKKQMTLKFKSSPQIKVFVNEN